MRSVIKIISRHLMLFLLLLAGAWQSVAQNTIGIPNIINYPKQVYHAGNQNWAITQDKNGIVYFANNDGLLTYDGAFWKTYQLPNKTIARSVVIDKDDRIYVGGQGEIGYFFPDKKGELAYTSLNSLLSGKDNDFTDVWNICLYDGRVFFRSNKRVLEYDGKKITVHASIHWAFLSSASSELLAWEYTKGFVVYRNGQWVPRLKEGSFPAGIMVRSTTPIGKDSVLITSLLHGLFIMHGDKLTPFETPDIKAISAKNIYGAVKVSEDKIALITNLGGCIIIDKQGRYIQRFTKKEGIQNNNILSVLLDKDKNIWLGLDNGIDLITYNNSIKNIFPEQEDRNSGYTSIIHNNELYLGVSTGVYKVKLNAAASDISYTNGSFDFIERSKGQVWNLSNVNGKLLLGHTSGAYLIENGKAIDVDDKTGFWGFQPLYNDPASPVIVAGTYNGVNFYDYKNGVITNPRVHAQFESARFVVIGNDVIWIAHPYKGLYKVMYKDGKASYEVYNDKKKILSSNRNKIFKLKGKIILTTDNGIFEYDEKEKDFVHSVGFEKIFSGKPFSYCREDAAGNIWFTRDRKVGVVDFSGKEPKVVFIPEIDDRIMAGGFENINIIDKNNVFVAAEKGFFHINYEEYKKRKQPLHVLIRSVQSPLQKDRLIFGGYNELAATPRISYNNNSLYFACASVLYGQHNTEFSFYLENFDKDWSPWSKKTEKDYTNLPAGNYVFHVKCRNNFDNESAVSSFSFTVLPPWYQTYWAYALYALAFFAVIYLFYKRQQTKYKKREAIKLAEQQTKYAEEQKRLQILHELEIGKSEKEIVQLRNEKLQAEIGHKNSELASSAMNLVRKMEILSKIKEDLNSFKTHIDLKNGSAREFQKIIKLIDGELDHNEEWERFAMHFDSVHANYLKKLREYCPEISNAELKLAAYLRLNLSTKEIAQLLNISIRGVETSRYRLRKKLGLNSSDKSLGDFLSSVTGSAADEEGEEPETPTETEANQHSVHA
jgi:ligand-binding sensor domain-containing protein/DNA-binding CsgD family transcriptional regulator